VLTNFDSVYNNVLSLSTELCSQELHTRTYDNLKVMYIIFNVNDIIKGILI